MSSLPTRHVWTVTYRDPQNIAGSSSVVHFLDDGEQAFRFAAEHHTVSIREQVLSASALKRTLRIWGQS
jgi:hypothetical protein